MFFDQLSDRLRVEQASVPDSRLRQKIIRHFTQVVSQPVIDGGREPSFWLAKNFFGKDVMHGFSKNVLRCWLQDALQLQFRGHVPSDKFRQLPIQKWHPDLD